MQFEGTKELKTLRSKNALLLHLSQKFWALMSNLAAWSVIADRKEKISPDNGWRCGSIETFGQTSVKN